MLKLGSVKAWIPEQNALILESTYPESAKGKCFLSLIEYWVNVITQEWDHQEKPSSLA